VKCDVHKQLFM